MTLLQKLKRVPNKAVLVLIALYRFILSPSEGMARYLPLYPKNTCIFHPTCSAYAVLAYQKYDFLTATRKTINRIGRCHPGNTPAIDYP